MEATSEIDNSFYDQYGEKWYTAWDDPVALLRCENKVKFPWILERLKSHGLGGSSILDVGCGAGFLANELAIEGYKVTGVDLSPESLRVARDHDVTGTVTYKIADAFKLPFPDHSFEVVTSMDFLEHVENPALVIKEFSRVLKPKGLFFFHTFNRNYLSWLVVIKFLEWFIQNTPKNMHVLKLFIKPSELKHYCNEADLSVDSLTGIRPVLSSIDWNMIRSGIVSPGMCFTLTGSTLLSYMGMARKD